jgi:hypothetical protein
MMLSAPVYADYRALEHALGRYEDLRGKDDIAGAAVWDHVITKIRDIQNTTLDTEH